MSGMTRYLWIQFSGETDERDFRKGYKKEPQCKDSEGMVLVSNSEVLRTLVEKGRSKMGD